MELKWIRIKDRNLCYAVGVREIKVYDQKNTTQPLIARPLDEPAKSRIDFKLERHLVRIQRAQGEEFKVQVISLTDILQEPLQVNISGKPKLCRQLNSRMIVCTQNQLTMVDLATGVKVFRLEAQDTIKDVKISERNVYMLSEDGRLQQYAIQQDHLQLAGQWLEIESIEVANNQLACVSRNQLLISSRLVATVGDEVQIQKMAMRNSHKQLLLAISPTQILIVNDGNASCFRNTLAVSINEDTYWFAEQFPDGAIHVLYYIIPAQTLPQKLEAKRFATLSSNDPAQYHQITANISSLFLDNGVLNPEIEAGLDLPANLEYAEGGASLHMFKYILNNYRSELIRIGKSFGPRSPQDYSRYIYYVGDVLQETRDYGILEEFIGVLIDKYKFQNKEVEEALMKLRTRIRVHQRVYKIQQSSLTSAQIAQIFKQRESNSSNQALNRPGLLLEFFPQSHIRNPQIRSKQELIQFLRNIDNQYLVDYFIGVVDPSLLLHNRQLILGILQAQRVKRQRVLAQIVSRTLASQHTNEQIFKYLIGICLGNQHQDLALFILFSGKINWKRNIQFVIRIDSSCQRRHVLYNFDILKYYGFCAKQIESFLLTYFNFLRQSNDLQPLRQFPIGVHNIRTLRPFLRRLNTLYT